MSKFLRTAVVITSIAVGASVAQAQQVGMAGSYIEGNGIIVQIPQNPPLKDCDPVVQPLPDGAEQGSAWCINKRNLVPQDLITELTPTFMTQTTMVPPALTGTTMAKPYIRQAPNVGVMGARFIDTPGTNLDALELGGQFTVPPLAFTQRLGQQVGQVLGGGPTVQLDTTFTNAAPGTFREKNQGESRFLYSTTEFLGRAIIGTNTAYVPNPTTRVMKRNAFSPTNVNANGFNNGRTTMDPNYRYRQALTTTKQILVSTPSSFPPDELRLAYSNARSQDGLGFGGTMTILLDGSGRLYLDTAQIEEAFPVSLRPVVATNPVGDDIPGFNDRNGAGWEMTVPGRQVPGIIKAFGPAIPFVVEGAIANVNIKGKKCGLTAFDDTCNLIGWTYPETTPSNPTPTTPPVRGGSFFTQGAQLGALGAAQSTKFMFGWTTGTVSIVRTGPRGGVVQTLTQTAMGYDSITDGGNRNVGLVAGSFTQRTSAASVQMNTQVAGIDLQFTPEPGSTIALISGLGLLGALGVRRRS